MRSLVLFSVHSTKVALILSDAIPSDTEAGLIYLQGLIPSGSFGIDFPPIVLKHQIYSIIKNKTLVDKEIVSKK